MALFLASILIKYYWPTKKLRNYISFIGCTNTSRKRQQKVQETQFLVCLTLLRRCTALFVQSDYRPRIAGNDEMWRMLTDMTRCIISEFDNKTDRIQKNIKLGQSALGLLNGNCQDHWTQRDFLAPCNLRIVRWPTDDLLLENQKVNFQYRLVQSTSQLHFVILRCLKTYFYKQILRIVEYSGLNEIKRHASLTQQCNLLKFPQLHMFRVHTPTIRSTRC